MMDDINSSNAARGADEWNTTYGTPDTAPRLVILPLNKLVPWISRAGSPQPFRMYSAAQMADLVSSVRKKGIITPITVRPWVEGQTWSPDQFQIVAGHNRVEAARQVGLNTIPAYVINVDDDAAEVMMIESNLSQRWHLLASEKAAAYKQLYDAYGRRAGRPSENACHDGTVFGRTDELIAANAEDSARTIQRYIRINLLIPPLLDLVDQKKIGLVPAEKLSFISSDGQRLIFNFLSAAGKDRISGTQAESLRSAFLLDGSLTQDRLLLIFEEAEKRVKLTLELPETLSPLINAAKKDGMTMSEIVEAVSKILKEIQT